MIRRAAPFRSTLPGSLLAACRLDRRMGCLSRKWMVVSSQDSLFGWWIWGGAMGGWAGEM